MSCQDIQTSEVPLLGLSLFAGKVAGPKTYQEDQCGYLKKGEIIVVWDYDGHGGYNGMVASRTASRLTDDFLKRNEQVLASWSVEEWSAKLEFLFDLLQTEINKELLSDHPMNVCVNGVIRHHDGTPVTGGTTGTVLVCLKKGDNPAVIITANVGDSSAMLIEKNDQGSLDYKFLTAEHNASNQDEYQRIQALDLEKKMIGVYELSRRDIKRHDMPRVFPVDQNLLKNPWAHFCKPSDIRYSLATYLIPPESVVIDSFCHQLSRSLGNSYIQQFGMTHKPEIRVTQSVTKNPIIVVGSDGFWDCWKFDQLIGFIQDQSKIDLNLLHPVKLSPNDDDDNIDPGFGQVGKALMVKTTELAIDAFGARYFDDISMVCFTWT